MVKRWDGGQGAAFGGPLAAGGNREVETRFETEVKRSRKDRIVCRCLGLDGDCIFKCRRKMNLNR